jgi:hypothetical protein
MLTWGLLCLWALTMLCMAVTAWLVGVMIVWVVGIVGNVTLCQCWIVPKCTQFLNVLTHSAVYTALVSVTNRTARTWNWHCFVWNIRLQLNRYQLEVPLGRSNLHAGINVIVYLCIVCRCKWKSYNLNFFFVYASETFNAVPQLSFSLHLSFYFHDP